MKAALYIAVATVLLFTPSDTTAQDAGGLFITVGLGGITYTNEYDFNFNPTPVDVGYVGRLGFQFSLSNPRFRLGLEFEYSSIQLAFQGIQWFLYECLNYNPVERCIGDSNDLYGVALSLQTIFGGMRNRVRPYGAFGIGMMGWDEPSHSRAPTHLGPNLDLAFGLEVVPFTNRLISIAVEPRYTYFPKVAPRYDFRHLSLTIITRIQLTRRRDKDL